MSKKGQWPHQDRRSRRQRGRRGFADSDVWNLDAYLSVVIADTLDHLATHDHGYPTDFADDGEWSAWLHETAGMFRAYYDDEDGDDYVTVIANLREGLARLSQRWGSLWD